MDNRKAQLRYISQEEQGLQLCRISTVAEILSSRGHVGLVDEKHATAKIYVFPSWAVVSIYRGPRYATYADLPLTIVEALTQLQELNQLTSLRESPARTRRDEGSFRTRITPPAPHCNKWLAFSLFCLHTRCRPQRTSYAGYVSRYETSIKGVA